MARTQKPRSIPFGMDRERYEALKTASEGFKNWVPGVEALTNVQAVPTIFPQYNVATRVGGHPLARTSIVHGPSSKGKTSFVLGLGRSFLERGHFFGFVDAERTTPLDYTQRLLRDSITSPGFQILPASTYEVVVDGVQRFCEHVGNLRATNKLPSDTTALIVVDSIRKLFPKDLMQTLLKHGADEDRYSRGVDGMSGRGAQIKARLNAAWVDALTPLLNDTNCAITFIARETVVKSSTNGFDREEVTVGGGSALIFEASLIERVVSTLIPHPDDKTTVVGERGRVEIHKTKIGDRIKRVPQFFFHTSNGLLCPKGFDRARDVLELAVEHKVVEKRGSWYVCGDERLGQGEVKALELLRANLELCQEIEELAVKTGLEVNRERDAREGA